MNRRSRNSITGHTGAACAVPPNRAPHARAAPEKAPLPRPEGRLRKLHLEPTNRCNISCITCMRNSWNEPTGFMPMDVFERLARQLRDLPDLRAIQFGGYGEPLLHPHIARMVERAHRRGVRTELLTNGLLLTEAVAEALAHSGLDAILLSLDGASPATYSRVRGGSDLRRVIENVQQAAKIHWRVRRALLEIGIVFVAMKSNFREFGELRSLALSLGATSITVTNLLPHDPEMIGEVLYGRDVPTAFEPRGGRWNPDISIPKMDLTEHTAEPLLELLRNHPSVSLLKTPLSGWENYCRFVQEGRAAVGWDGGVSPCLQLMHSHKCFVLRREKTIRRCVLGDVKDRRLPDIWNAPAYVALRDRVARFDFPPCPDCGRCEMVASNQEDCFGNPFPVCGDCLWARGILQCP